MCGPDPTALAPSYLDLEAELAAAEAEVARLRGTLETIASDIDTCFRADACDGNPEYPSYGYECPCCIARRALEVQP